MCGVASPLRGMDLAAPAAAITRLESMACPLEGIICLQVRFQSKSAESPKAASVKMSWLRVCAMLHDQFFSSRSLCACQPQLCLAPHSAIICLPSQIQMHARHVLCPLWNDALGAAARSL